MSKAALDTLYTAYSVAIEAADYDTAISKLVQLQALLATMPDVQVGDAGGHSTRYREIDIPALIAECRKLSAEANAASSGPLQRTNVTYARATT